jgi:D-proline reductase (dithiol) PrdB
MADAGELKHIPFGCTQPNGMCLLQQLPPCAHSWFDGTASGSIKPGIALASAMVGQPVPYMERTRLYYRALGYPSDYVWAHYADVPFAHLAKPLSDCRIALITTASSPSGVRADGSVAKQVWSGDVAPPPERLFTDNVAWDKESTHTRDRESFLPIETAAGLAREGRFAGLTQHFHGVPTEYSQRKTLEHDAPQVLSRLRGDGADAAILCPL